MGVGFRHETILVTRVGEEQAEMRMQGHTDVLQRLGNGTKLHP